MKPRKSEFINTETACNLDEPSESPDAPFLNPLLDFLDTLLDEDFDEITEDNFNKFNLPVDEL